MVCRREEITQEEAQALFQANFKNTARNWQKAKTLMLAEMESTSTAAGTLAQDELDQLSDEGFAGLFRGGLDWEKHQRGRQY